MRKTTLVLAVLLAACFMVTGAEAAKKKAAKPAKPAECGLRMEPEEHPADAGAWRGGCARSARKGSEEVQGKEEGVKDFSSAPFARDKHRAIFVQQNGCGPICSGNWRRVRSSCVQARQPPRCSQPAVFSCIMQSTGETGDKKLWG